MECLTDPFRIDRIGTEVVTWENHRKHNLFEEPGDLPIVEVGSLASNKHLNNKIRVYHLLSHFEEKAREGKKTTKGSESDLNGNDMKSLFQNLVLRALRRYTRGMEKNS